MFGCLSWIFPELVLQATSLVVRNMTIQDEFLVAINSLKPILSIHKMWLKVIKNANAVQQQVLLKDSDFQYAGFSCRIWIRFSETHVH